VLHAPRCTQSSQLAPASLWDVFNESNHAALPDPALLVNGTLIEGMWAI